MVDGGFLESQGDCREDGKAREAAGREKKGPVVRSGLWQRDGVGRSGKQARERADERDFSVLVPVE
jgi:hypothetical protein